MAIRLVCLISLFLTHTFHGTLRLPLLLHQVRTRANGCDLGLLDRASTERGQRRTLPTDGPTLRFRQFHNLAPIWS
ncbi:hypothetical protein BKA82DRAFT_746339 [Pisolithus tinctorius]|uniref:Secreted protein n=1 Tax=Pisolithus tinctorius Marx 270 TaxID=870435 RepID=A0A0C3NLP3_PISTI|nr:hypothetical protein BKA82DRAFT_746339 [Pisolithus tinctorius]KIN96560.1 hypothetical protein M404DRAFT_244570 [Pisolithus tinctorius Marx 270]KIO11998.1 hypothetical protein M404DRAFT_746339 [Pisolithus tinctorius Marx 270]